MSLPNLGEGIKSLAKKRKEKNKHPRQTREERLQALYAKYEITPDGPTNSSTAHIMLKVFSKRYLALFLLCLLIFLCLCTYYYIDSFRTASTVMTLNYEESAKGLTPNNTRFNVYDITSNEVLNQAIQYAGLENKVTPEELSKNLTVSETYTREATDENYYITTSYVLRLQKPRHITSISANDMLELICKAYKDRFYNSYTINTSVLSRDYDDLDDMEYTEIGSLFSMRASQINRYLAMREKERTSYTSEETGESFNSLDKLINNLVDYQIADYNAYIWENGIVKDADNYRATLNYTNDQLSKEQVTNYNEFAIRKDTINVFSSPMSTSILIPTYNKKMEFYMARTKTGVDYLASEADYYLDTSEKLKQGIAKNVDRLAKVTDAPAEQKKKADTMIAEISKELQRIERLVTTTDKEYMAQKTRNYLTFDVREQSLLYRLHIKRVVALCFLFFVLAFFAFYKEYKLALKGAAAR